jgi:hypothetical protein
MRDPKFKLGQIVYLITDEEQKGRLVTEVIHKLSGGISYQLTHCVETTYHFEGEISDEMNVLTKVK